MFPQPGTPDSRINSPNNHYTYHDSHDDEEKIPLLASQPPTTSPVAPAARAVPTDYKVRHAHYRHIPRSQRSLSPPRTPWKPPSFKGWKNACCLPLHCGKVEGSGDANGQAAEPEEQLNARTANPTLDVSILSSEEQTRAPEGDKLPIFTRLRDWTEHERTKIMAKVHNVEEKEDKDEKEEEMHLPPRPVSMPPSHAAMTPPAPEVRSASEGDIPGIKQDWPTPTPPPKIPLRKASPREKIGFVEVAQPPPQLQPLPVVPPKEVAWEPAMMMPMPGTYPTGKGTWRFFEAPQHWHDVRML
ncbi:hypothetical protein ABW21_db0208318 [Orbilia brochopaga]|nr:hypothetical protein ABW21_db0208318 [Drechslerella brochopaga]